MAGSFRGAKCKKKQKKRKLLRAERSALTQKHKGPMGSRMVRNGVITDKWAKDKKVLLEGTAQGHQRPWRDVVWKSGVAASGKSDSPPAIVFFFGPE